jgi:RNA polymerase sigma-70 factor, ECF subfamily
VARLRAGDESAFREIVQRYHTALMRLALAFRPNRVFAEEVVQDTWTNVVDGLSSFRGQSSLKTWIWRILMNRAQTLLDREARSVPLSALQGCDPDEPVDATRFFADGNSVEPPQSFNDESPEEHLMCKETMRCIERALQRLPLNQRAVVTMRDVEGLESYEVCNILRIGVTNQRVLLHRARSKLRRVLEEQLIEHRQNGQMRRAH